mgnify:CR=1 FL=1
MFVFEIFGGELEIIPSDIIDLTGFTDMTYTFALPFVLASFGTSMSISGLKSEGKAVLTAVLAVACIVGLGVIEGFTFMDLRTAIYGPIEVAGGGQAGLMFLTALREKSGTESPARALDYVLKPVPYFAFSQQLRKAEEQLRRRARHYLALPVEGGMRRLDSSLIYYLESEGHRVHFYTEEGDFVAAGTLKAFEEKLAERPFARCNSGYLVNLAQVKSVQQGMVQVGPYELQVSRPRRKAFLAALADHIGGEGA